MWTILKSKIQPRTISRVIDEAAAHATMKESRHFVSAGKKFFYADADSPNRLPLLKTIHGEIAGQARISDVFQMPVIDHAYLLFKSAGAPATAMHQDRAFWLDKEETPTLMTAWVSLSRINASNGALVLNISNRVEPESLPAFNKSGTLYEHVEYKYGGEYEALSLNADDAERLRHAMQPIPAEAGEVIIFDGFEPHASMDNTSDASRLALKIVYGEGLGRPRYLITVEELEAVQDAAETTAPAL